MDLKMDAISYTSVSMVTAHSRFAGCKCLFQWSSVSNGCGIPHGQYNAHMK